MYINELLHHYTLRRSLRASDSNFLFSNIIQQNCVLDEGQSFLVDLLTLGMTAPFFAENVYRVKGYFFKKNSTFHKRPRYYFGVLRLLLLLKLPQALAIERN